MIQVYKASVLDYVQAKTHTYANYATGEAASTQTNRQTVNANRPGTNTLTSKWQRTNKQTGIQRQMAYS